MTALAQEHDTHLSGAPFADGDDRRASARIPFEREVRVGPAYGAPYATVRAENLSSGGIFIHSADPAELGARFSVELKLAEAQSLYIPEAEILYNRDDALMGPPGFGARFASLTAEVQAIIEQSARFSSELAPIPPAARVTSDWPNTFETELPELAVSLPPEPSASGRPEQQEDTDVVRNRRPNETNQTRILRAMRSQVAGRARQKPLLWAAGIAGLVLGVAMLSSSLRGGSAEAQAAPDLSSARGLSADTHDMLLGHSDEVVGVEPKEQAGPAAAPVVSPLPELVEIPKAKKPTPAVAAEVETKAAAKEAVVAAKVKESKPAAKDGFRAKLPKGTKILRSHALKEPARFVVDLSGHHEGLTIPAGGAITGVRVGKHPDHTRLVFDSKKAISSGTASIEGSELVVRIRN